MEPQILLAGRAVEELVAPCDANVDPRTGSAVVTVQIPVSAGRSGFSPSLSLAYGSGAGNCAFGHGWSLAGVAPILISTADGLPGSDGHDRFASPVGEDLVLELVVQTDGTWRPRIEERGGFVVGMFRSRADRARVRFLKWGTTAEDPPIHRYPFGCHRYYMRILAEGDVQRIKSLERELIVRIPVPQNYGKGVSGRRMGPQLPVTQSFLDWARRMAPIKLANF